MYMQNAHNNGAARNSGARITDDRTVLVLSDGVCVPVREVRPEDASALKRLVGRLSERSAYLRYFGSMKELSDGQARRFAEVDGTDRFALVALDPEDEEEIVAVVRYDRGNGEETDSAEYAALVEDRFQGRGLGMGLTKRLIEAARERGLMHLEAYVLHENKAMLRLIRGLGLPEQIRWEDGVELVEIHL